jgi:hypothetical protein
MKFEVVMNKKEAISQIFKILLLYEDVYSKDNNVTENDYIGYLDRLYVYWLGVGSSEIYNIVKGLRILGAEADHKTVRSMVFHTINLIEKGDNDAI